ncbi:MAG: urease subunit beta [Nitrosopumilales archaeon CG_4_10_14_0_8_um_filter_34_8]|jgi:urease subunit beta|nr:MAG: urease subunit beta [Nitrosopumilales archaeon CG_4_10_14_0_8_um_filter_34_8]
MIPGEYFLSDEPITANVGKSILSISVRNTGDRPIQVGSHTHFFEVNKSLEFPRKQSYGFRLNIPAGTSVRFEPGETKEIQITEFGGKKVVFGFSGLVNGNLKEKQEEAFKKASEKGFKGL